MKIIKENKLNGVLLLVFLVLIAIVIQTSLAKYVKGVDGNVELTMASWNIKVNNESIIGKDTLTNKLVPVFEENEYINADVIAPGATGYFDIVIDPTKADVAFRYEVSAIKEGEGIDDIDITGYEILDTDGEHPVTDKVIGRVPLNSDPFTIRFYVSWIDGTGETMDNKADTEVVQNYDIIPFNVSIKFIQITG